MRKTLLLAGLVGGLISIAPATASADVRYDVSVHADGSWSYDNPWSLLHVWSHDTGSGSFLMEGGAGSVSFTDDGRFVSAPEEAGTARYSARASERFRGNRYEDPSDVYDRQCSGQTARNPVEGPSVSAEQLANDDTRFELQLIRSMPVVEQCDDGSSIETDLAAFDDVSFVIPTSQVGEATITVPIQGRVTDSSCPGWRFTGNSCTYSYHGSVLFRRTSGGPAPEQQQPAPQQPAPQPPAPPAPQPQQQPQPPREQQPPRQRPRGVVGSPRLDRARIRGTEATVRIRCSGRCSGDVTAFPRNATGSPRAIDVVPFSRGRFNLPNGGTTTVRVRFDRADMRQIRRDGGVHLTVGSRRLAVRTAPRR